MEKLTITRLNLSFEEHVNEHNGIEYWLARDLQKLLEYTEWRNFLKIIEKARESCKNALEDIPEHFVDFNKSFKMLKSNLSLSI